jgi:radical SAM protein (TIGR01212 family)
VELGLQSTHDETLKMCNRGHTFADFIRAVSRLTSDGIEVVAHMMLGLPGETFEMMNESARRLAELPCQGVKLHQLMIIRETRFEKWYHTGRCSVLSIEEYSEALCSFLSFLRPDQQIHRLVAESTVENGLVAPVWSTEKMKSLQMIHAYMDKRDVRQGSNWEGTEKPYEP